MITANNMIPVGFVLGESNFEVELMQALANQTRKYNTAVATSVTDYSLAPIVLADAILASGCDVTQVCAVPNVLKNTRLQMQEACKICITDLSDGAAVVYGIDKNDPEPNATLDAAKSKEQSLRLAYSMMKTYWLGNPAYIAADLRNAALLPAYKKDLGQWGKILASTPNTVTITENAGTTAVDQKVSYNGVLNYINDMVDNKQSISLMMVDNSQKNIWITSEMFDTVQTQREANALAGIRFVPIENEFGNFDSFVYRDIQVIKYEHFTAAIRDLSVVNAGTIKLPNRMVLTVGLPTLSFPVPTEGTFKTEYNAATRAYTASTLATILHPEAVAGDYYVVAY